MLNLSGGELLILMVIVLLVFGARGLPDAGRVVGKGIREFQRALNEARDALDRPEPPRVPPPPPAVPRKRLTE